MTTEVRQNPENIEEVRTPWGPIGEQVYKRTYSLTKADGSKETWPETVTRAVDGNLALVDPKFIERDEREKLIELMLPFGILPAGRHLNASGVKGRQFLFNCLAGNTRVLTKKGWLPIRECANIGEIEVLAQGSKEQTGVGCWTYGQGEWRKAQFKYFGEQELYTVTFSDGTEVEATADHKWYVTKRSNPVETTNLVGMNVPFVTAPKPEKGEMFQAATLHGFVFGDGNLNYYNGKPHSSHVRMFAEKDNDVAALFEKAGFDVTHPSHCNAYVGRLPADWKFLPSETASREYWYGFIVGLIAADGTVSEQSGSVILYQSDKEALEIIHTKAMECGFACTPVMMQREKNPWTGEISPNWRFTMRRFSVQPDELILSQHRTNFTEAGIPSNGRSLEVISVKNTGRKEATYCAIEPETHTFVIENSLLTGNCHAAGWDYLVPEDHFSFTFDELMMGGGVGSNYSNRYVHKMPQVRRPLDLHIICREDHPNYAEFAQLLSSHNGYPHHFVVPDSREGWVQAVELLCRMAWAHEPAYGSEKEIGVTIEVSQIRARGEPLKTSGGIACGPGPLVQLLSDLAKQLNSMVDRAPTSMDFMILDHHLAEGVIAGGKRRSSRIAVKNWYDEDIFDFINCKRQNGAHWTANISVEVDDEFFVAYHCPTHGYHEHAKKVMRAVVLGKRTNGEPGLWNRALAMEHERDPEAMYCPNPCGEIGLHMWEACNLGHVNMEHFAKGIHSLVKMEEAFRLMTRWLIRATFGDIPQPRQRKVVDENRRIGVGFLGFHAWLALRGIKYSDCWRDETVKTVLKRMADRVKHEAYRYSQQLGIPVPVKNTTLAPTGTIALMPGTTSSAQAMMAPWYKRLVRYSSMDPELEKKRSEGYEVFADKDAKNTDIVVYWCEDPLTAKVRAAGFDVEETLEGQYDVSLHDNLMVQKMLQEVYVDNSISFTINLSKKNMPSEAELEKELIDVLPFIKGTTVFPNKSRYDAPFQPITKAEFDAYQGKKEVFQVEDECKGGCPIK